MGRVEVFGSFNEILNQHENPSLIVVDIPIGLPKLSPPKGRLVEADVRPRLGPRKSSVFRVPSRDAVYAGVNRDIFDDLERYKNACRIARKTSVDKKAFAKQGFYLLPKIVEVDELLRKDRQLIARVYESHPEVAFWRLNSERHIEHSKKSPEGIGLRMKLLIEAGLPSEKVRDKPPRGAKRDDLLDAYVCAVVATRIGTVNVRSFPEAPEKDCCEIPMAIWA